MWMNLWRKNCLILLNLTHIRCRWDYIEAKLKRIQNDTHHTFYHSFQQLLRFLIEYYFIFSQLLANWLSRMWNVQFSWNNSFIHSTVLLLAPQLCHLNPYHNIISCSCGIAEEAGEYHYVQNSIEKLKKSQMTTCWNNVHQHHRRHHYSHNKWTVI